MLHFKRLRLNGFKSFVDPTTLDIDMGLTGIVGPNGCGKSNLVEALKWVMGETSAKQMRGGEMDDVIFAGSDRRPSRNVAEVVLTLDNATQGGPAQFAEADDLEIARRIEREKGSLYKINGQDMRARDVQLLFAGPSDGCAFDRIGQPRPHWCGYRSQAHRPPNASRRGRRYSRASFASTRG